MESLNNEDTDTFLRLGNESQAMEGLHRLVPIKNGISNFQVGF